MKSLRFWSIGVLVCLGIGVLVPRYIVPVHAAITSCTVDSIDPASLQTASSQQFTITVTNTDDANIVRWVQFHTPSSSLIASEGSATGWGVNNSGDIITFVDGQINPGSTTTFSITLSSGGEEIGAQSWSVSMADNSSGTNSVSCSGEITTAISGIGQQDSVAIENVTVSDVAATSVHISFTTTTSATSTLEYGPDDGYGSQLEISSGTTSHSYTISGLTANTTYHYAVTAVSGEASAGTDDATFTTALNSSATSTPGPTSTPRVVNNTTLITPTPAPDTQAPTVTLSALSKDTYSQPPSITGTAGDNQSVESVQYSTDAGKTWKSIKTISGLGTTYATFTIIPDVTTEGKVSVIVQAKDGAGNTKKSTAVSFTLDKTGPVITLSTDLDSAFSQSPKIQGTAKDSANVSGIEYAFQSGAFQTVDTLTGQDTVQAGFSFSLPPLDDGNYTIAIRARDSLGNTTTATKTLIIDRLPPRIGGAIVSNGPELLTEHNPISVSTNTLYGLTVSAVGGPTEMSVTTTLRGKTITFPPLQQNATTGRWTTNLSFTEPGDYLIHIHAVDGANNVQDKNMMTFHVVPQGTIVGGTGERVKGTITLYVRDSVTGKFVVWDSSPYGQVNPQLIGEAGTYHFFPPAGDYYLDITPSTGAYKRAVTNQFSVVSPTPLTGMITLENAPALRLPFFTLYMPTFYRTQLSYSAVNDKQDIVVSPFAFPDVTLSAGELTLSPKTLRGKTSLVTVLNTWSPETPEQIKQLEEVMAQQYDMKLFVVIPEESKSLVDIFVNRGGYSLPFLSDPEGSLIVKLPYITVPSHYIVNEQGQVTRVLTGLRSAVELTNAITPQ